MVIQRWQSVLLLLAAIAMGVLPFVNFGVWTIDGVDKPMAAMVCLPAVVTGVLACVLYLVDIFLFNNFRQQKMVLKIAQLLTVVTFAIFAFLNISTKIDDGISVTWGCAAYLPIVAFLLGFWAMKRIRADEKKLRSADRLR